MEGATSLRDGVRKITHKLQRSMATPFPEEARMDLDDDVQTKRYTGARPKPDDGELADAG